MRVNYLLSLETQGETFHVINISWFSMKVYHKFCSFNICSSFSTGSIDEGTKRNLHYMPHKSLQFIHCPCKTFSMEKIRSSVPYNIYLAQAAFL